MASAYWIGDDATTQGGWLNKYGRLGYHQIEGADHHLSSSLPSGVSISVVASWTYSWTSSIPDARATIRADGSTRDADCWYTCSGDFAFAITQSDSMERILRFYMLDWDSTTRVQSLTFVDHGNSATLVSRSYSGFHDGLWSSFLIRGSVDITLHYISGGNGVVSSLLFDQAPLAAAHFLGG